MISCIIAVISGLLVLAIDQITKCYVVANFNLGDTAGLIDGVINFVYIHNRGAAWGMLSGHTWILLVITAVIMVVCVYFLINSGFDNKLIFWAVILVLCGGVGNMIDRIFRDGNVVDFLHFEFWPQFPVFNIADCAIVIGAGLLILHFIIEIINESKLKKSAEQENNADNTESL